MQTISPPSQERPERAARAPETRVTTPTKFQSLEARIDGERSARIPPLNLDIISNILERRFELFANSWDFRHGAHHWQPRQAQLLDLCIVSSQWLEPCPRLLYRGFYAHNSDSIVKFASALRQNPALGLYVRYLFVRNWDIAHSVSLMPNIELLWLYARDLPIFISSSILLLKRVRHVNFANGEFKVARADGETARTAWPHLETLVSKDP